MIIFGYEETGFGSRRRTYYIEVHEMGLVV